MKISNVLSDNELKERVSDAVECLAGAVAETMGPRGRTVLIQTKEGKPIITKDGVTVAKYLSFEDKFMNSVCSVLKQSAMQTNIDGGDGPQPLYSRILTPGGWTTMGELKIGDEVCGTNKTKQKVVGVFPKGPKEIYRISTSDGRTVECCEDHLWQINTSYGKTKILTTKQMFEKGWVSLTSNGDKLHHFYLPHNEVGFEEEQEKMPVDSYLLGVLLGDGYLSNTTTPIELSIGFRKEFILGKLQLPEGCGMTKRKIQEKNYIKVRFVGTENGKPILKKELNKLNVLGTKSHTKFIPKSYLYSSTENRKKLLQGLIDTDGYTNKRELFEYSTVSKQLHDDFVELCRSLGIPIGTDQVVRKENDGAFGKRTIYRVFQRKGYKNGIKIIDIAKTGEFTEMQCIKVSNEDNLYITNDFIVTHNTSTSTVLTRAIYKNAQVFLNLGIPAIEIQRGINHAVQVVLGLIKKHSKQIESLDDIENIATISANGEREIGKLIAKAIDYAGKDGAIVIEESKTPLSSIEGSEGYFYNAGFGSSEFINNVRSQMVEFEDVRILITDEKITKIKDIFHVLEFMARDKKPLVIIADDVQEEALAALIVNARKGALKVAVVKPARYGEERRIMMKDLALSCGATFISKYDKKSLSSVRMSDLGRCKRCEIGRFGSVFVETQGDINEINQRIEGLKAQIKQVKDLHEAEKLQERVTKLSSAVITIKVGGATEIELIEKKYRFEDALMAVRSAREEGVLPGGGSFLAKASKLIEAKSKELSENEKIGAMVLAKALKEPLKTIASNAGLSPDVILNSVTKEEDFKIGCDMTSGEIVDMLESGILDPAKVTRCALQNAASAAGTLLMMNYAIIEL